MKLLLDETGLTLGDLDPDKARDVIESLLDVVDAAAAYDDERIGRSNSVYDIIIWRDLRLWELVYGCPPDAALADTLRRLGLAIDRMRPWDEDGTPETLSVEIAGQISEGLTLAWAWSCARRGEAVGCLIFRTADRDGRVPLTAGGESADVWFVSTTCQRIRFLRESIEHEAVPPNNFQDRAERAFPTLLWCEDAFQELRSHKGSFFGVRLPITLKHLSVLDDHGARIFHEYKPTHERAARLGSHGIDASPESPNTHANTTALSERRRIWRAKKVSFEWHTKITPTDGRIYFLHEPPSDRGDPTHPHGRIVIGLFHPHLST